MKVILSKSDTCINNKCIGICLFGTKYMQLDLECLSSEESGNKKKDAGIFYTYVYPWIVSLVTNILRVCGHTSLFWKHFILDNR